MAISEIRLFRDEDGRAVEHRKSHDNMADKGSFWGHFNNMVYNEEHKLTANAIVRIKGATTIEEAFAGFDMARQDETSRLTMSFIRFLDENPERAAELKAAAAAKATAKARHAAATNRTPLTGDRHVDSPETANVGKAPSLFKL